jgi:hypothetical protein
MRGPTSPAARKDHTAAAIDIPGHEFPSAVYITILGAFAWMLVVAWLAFSSPEGTDLDLGVATVLAFMFFGIPLAIHRTSMRRTGETPLSVRRFRSAPFDTFTGPMPAWQAWMEVALIPVALATAATLFGYVYAFAS